MTYPQNPQGQYPGQNPYPGGQQPYPGSQPTPAQQPYPGSQPTPAQQQPYSGSQPMPAQPYPGSQPMPAQPYGQAPGQYPQQPYGQQQQPYPAYPGGPGALQPKPSGATAIIAGVLAILGGLFALFGVVGGAILLGHSGGVGPGLVALIVNLAQAGLLLYGAVALFMHKPAGRLCVLIGSGLAIAVSVVSVVLITVGVSAVGGGAEVIGAGIAGALVGLIPPIATLVLALVKPTVEWVSQGAQQPATGGYPQQPSW
ncbi:hypothetical protein [Amycolatopsis jiangsuensis]|uniref:Uncharacterized protein n=1 Tax=Amycolatopsis jiangsuensis TaxID=1181879 RepID=A0A840J4A5_9PSEU|nr:hypothetical protein [Amycolatopsis jiangsuensis]MBB4688455.1 hypothetical protein [Amycolatopsis jiangsuensis]